jgi:hypothetical protein
VAAAIDIVAGVRQFEISHPAARAPLGYARSFAFGNRVTTTRARMSRLNPSA